MYNYLAIKIILKSKVYKIYFHCCPLGKLTPPFLFKSADFAVIIALVWPFCLKSLPADS